MGILLLGASAGSSFNGGLSETNLQGVEFMFLNIAKEGQGWSEITGSAYPNPDAATGFNFDANGYPRRIINGGVQSTYVIPTNAQRSWADVGGVGAYTFKWDGGGTVAFGGFTVVTGSATSSALSVNNTVTLRATTNRPAIGITVVTSSTDYPRNFRLYYTADQADVDAGYLLTAAVREKWAQAKFGVVRFLNWQTGSLGGGNGNMQATWEQRKPTGYWSYSAQEIKTESYAGVTTTPVDSQHYVLATHNHPIYGTAAAVDKQLIHIKPNANQPAGVKSYLEYNGRVNVLATKRGDASIPVTDFNTGVLAVNQYYTLIYDALLECWLINGSGNASPVTRWLENGVPPEVQLQAAIELRSHPWFLTPSYAADAGTGAGALTDYMGSFIDMVRAGAPSWMKPIWEPANEWWNNAAAWTITPWSNARQLVRNGGAKTDGTTVPFKVTSFTRTAGQTITGAAVGASGKVRLTMSSTADMTTGEIRTVTGVLGTVEANGVWPITKIDATHIDLDGSVFANTWSAGGTQAINGQLVMVSDGTVPPLGANLTTLSATPAGVSAFNAQTLGYAVAVSGGGFTFDTAASAAWAGVSVAATFDTGASTMTVPTVTVVGSAFQFTTTGTLPSPLVVGTPYYVKTASASGVATQISLTNGGTAITLTGGSGTHTATQIVVLTPNAADFHNTYGMSSSELGRLLQTKYGGSPKTQTDYRMVTGLQAGNAEFIGGTVTSNPRATSKHMVIRSADATKMAKLYSTHVSPANYFHWTAYNSTQEATLATAANGMLFTAGISGNQMTIASFQNTGSTTISVGDTVFGQGLPAPFGPGAVTVLSVDGGGVYTLSSSAYTIATGTQLYSIDDYSAVQTYLDSANATEFEATISNGSGSSGNQMVVTSITPGAVGLGSFLYAGSDTKVHGGTITAATSINSGPSDGGVGTYTLGRNHLISTPTTFTLHGLSDLQQVNRYLTNWKTWAQAYGINKMMFYEGGYSPDYPTTGYSKIAMLRHAAKWVLSTTSFPQGTYSALLANYAYCDALTDGTFTAEYPSSYYLDGRYPTASAWAIWEDLYQDLIPPLVQANIDYNA